MSERAPNSLVVVDDVIRVTVVRVDYGYEDLIFVVSEGAEVPVVTDRRVLVVELAELGFVPCGVIELLNFVMGFFAVAVALPAGYMTAVSYTHLTLPTKA